MESPRPFSDREDDLLRRLWPSRMTDYELAERFGRHRGAVRRRAELIGLPIRRLARVRAEQARELA